MTSPHKVEIIRLKSGDELPEKYAMLTPLAVRLVEGLIGTEVELVYLTTTFGRVH